MPTGHLLVSGAAAADPALAPAFTGPPPAPPKLHILARSLKRLEGDSRPGGLHTTSRKDAPLVPWRDTGATVRW